jgi:hypothetical protein
MVRFYEKSESDDRVYGHASAGQARSLGTGRSASGRTTVGRTLRVGEDRGAHPHSGQRVLTRRQCRPSRCACILPAARPPATGASHPWRSSSEGFFAPRRSRSSSSTGSTGNTLVPLHAAILRAPVEIRLRSSFDLRVLGVLLVLREATNPGIFLRSSGLAAPINADLRSETASGSGKS